MKNTILKTILASAIALAPLTVSAASSDAQGQQCSQKKGERGAHGRRGKGMAGQIKRAMKKSNVSEASLAKVKALMESNKASHKALREEMKTAKASGDPVQISAVKARMADKQAELTVDIKERLTAAEWTRVQASLKEMHAKHESKRGERKQKRSSSSAK